MSVTQWSAGSTYTRVLNFGRFFSLKVRGRLVCGSPYAREYMVFVCKRIVNPISDISDTDDDDDSDGDAVYLCWLVSK